jgi:hypothetical protein
VSIAILFFLVPIGAIVAWWLSQQSSLSVHRHARAALVGRSRGLGMTADKVWRGFELNQVRLSVRLCAVYWHFLLALWLVLFSLLTPWVGDFAVICRGLLT